MIGWLLATIGTAALGSVFPVVNIELYLLGTVSMVQGTVWWALALAATVGQLAGKSLVYFAGRGSVTVGNRISRRTVDRVHAARSDGRWARWFDTIHRETERRPWWGRGVLFAGAVTGLPPFTVMCFVSGAAGVSFPIWLLVSMIGRAIHFLLVAGAPGFVEQLPFPFG